MYKIGKSARPFNHIQLPCITAKVVAQKVWFLSSLTRETLSDWQTLSNRKKQAIVHFVHSSGYTNSFIMNFHQKDSSQIHRAT